MPEINTPLVTVMVPVYNVERYLERCLDSIVNQTYRNLEIVLVNDGSTDRSEEICRQYMERDSRIYLYSQKNQGVAAARNTCLDHAHGEYLAFVDSDDYISLSCIEILLNALFEKDVSMSVCDYDCLGEEDGGMGTLHSGDQIAVKLMDLDDIHKVLSSKRRHMRFETVWGKLYQRKIFDGIRFPVGKVGEDLFVCPKIYCRVERIGCVDLKLYHYVQSQDSATRKNNIGRPYLDFVEADFVMLAYFREYGEGQHVRAAASRVVRDVINWYDYLGKDKQEVLVHVKEAEEVIFFVTGKRYFTARLILYRISPNLFRFAKRTCSWIRGKIQRWRK